MNPYEILGIEENASEDEIKEKYQSLAEEYTLNQDETTQEKLEELNRAYDLLMNSKNIYAEIRKLIEIKNFPLAESKLNMINERDNAEWNYLEGFICVQKGWFETGLNYIKKALELDPGNTEYISSMNTLQARIIEYATKYANQGVRPAAANNMNACGGGVSPFQNCRRRRRGGGRRRWGGAHFRKEKTGGVLRSLLLKYLFILQQFYVHNCIIYADK
nr:DnaJ domain-containing protein [Clostridium butyricum]